MGHHVDGLKFAGGSFSLFPEDKLRELLEQAHEYGVYVSTVSKLRVWRKSGAKYRLGRLDRARVDPI